MSPRKSSSLKLEYVLLALLEQKPMHGYELYQDLCEMKGISQIWHIKQAMLYAILDKLEKSSFLSSQQMQGETYPPRKYFSLTDSGKNALHEWIKTPVFGARDIRQEFLAKLIVTHRYGKAKMLELIRLQKQECQKWSHHLAENVPIKESEQIAQWVVYSFRTSWIESILNWLEACETEVQRLPESG